MHWEFKEPLDLIFATCLMLSSHYGGLDPSGDKLLHRKNIPLGLGVCPKKDQRQLSWARCGGDSGQIWYCIINK